MRGMLASATRTSIGGLRNNIPSSHLLGRVNGWTCRFMITLLAPMISNRRGDRPPIFVVAPRRCFPPVECCRGTRPSQAAKSRPRRKVSGGGARATKVVAISGPMPGIVISRRATSFSLARRLISASSLPIWSSKRVFVSIRISNVVLLALDEGLDVGWRDQTYFVAQLGDLAAPEMSAAAGFHRNDASWKLAKKHKNLRPSQFLAQHRSACAVSSVNLKYTFRQIEPDCDNL